MEIFDTDTAYFDMYHSTGTFNVSHIHDEQLDALLDEARTEPDSAKRDEIYVEVNQMLADAAYYVPLYFTPALVIYNKDLKGVEATRNERYQFKKYSW